VHLAAGTRIKGGYLQGRITGEASVLLEALAVKAGSSLANVTLGKGVRLAEEVVIGENVQWVDGETVLPADGAENAGEHTPEVLPPVKIAGMPVLGAVGVGGLGEPMGTKAQLSGGIAVNFGAFEQAATVQLTDLVDIRGNLEVDPAHVGFMADIVVYAVYRVDYRVDTESFYMLSPRGEVLSWDGAPEHLVAFIDNLVLTSKQFVQMYYGQLRVLGSLRIFLGYRLQNGMMIVNERAIEVRVGD
jgi:hypothetical protein